MQSERVRHNKIIFSGTVGAGKSTAINALSDILPVSTEALASDEIAGIKKTTTVAMDYGVLNLPDGEKVMLYGTPGQERFSLGYDRDEGKTYTYPLEVNVLKGLKNNHF